MRWLLQLLGPVMPYITAALLSTLVAAGGWIWLQERKIDKLEQEARIFEARISTCMARMKNILEDERDDASVDDPRDFDVPDRWLLPSGE